MLLEPTKLSRERIAVMAMWEAGKTKAWLDIMKATDSHFYVMDTDLAVPTFLDSKNYSDIDVENRLTLTHPLDWEDYVKPVRDWEKEATRDDWLVIDFMHPSWDAVQRYWIENIHGNDPEDYFAMARKQFEEDVDDKGQRKGKVFNPIKGDMDWPYIKKMYYSWTNRLRRWPGHLYVTMAAKPVVEDGNWADDKETQKEFGSFGVKPEGEKTTGFFPFTMLYLFRTGQKEHKFSTVKDKEREKVLNQKWNNFGVDYLMKIGGWKPVSDDD